MIRIRDLEFSYQVRVIDPRRSWIRNLLWSQYRFHPVLDGVNLELDGGGITALLGRNGAGKTTLIKLLSGILTPDRGSIRVLGFEPWRRQRDFLANVGVIFGQKKMLWRELTLRENLDITRALYRAEPGRFAEQVDLLIDLFELASLSDRPVKSYSLGESMKAELVNALSYEPRFLFLDEPTIGMDVGAQRTLRTSLRRYVEQQECRVILTSHNMRDIAALATEIFFLEHRSIRSFGPGPFGGDLESALEERLVG